jgi:GNAT superfamily N-acetyltransferase
MADAERFLASQRDVAFGEPGGWVQLAATDKVTGELCGDCAVRVLTDQPATAEIGVTLAPDQQGRGLAREALTAVIARLFEHHDLHRIYAEADDRNVAGPPASRGPRLALRGAPRRSRLVQRASGRRCAPTRSCAASGKAS